MFSRSFSSYFSLHWFYQIFLVLSFIMFFSSLSFTIGRKRKWLPKPNNLILLSIPFKVGRMDTDERIQFQCHGVDWVSQQQRESAASVDQAILLGLSKALEEETSFFGRRLAFRYVTGFNQLIFVAYFMNIFNCWSSIIYRTRVGSPLS